MSLRAGDSAKWQTRGNGFPWHVCTVLAWLRDLVFMRADGNLLNASTSPAQSPTAFTPERTKSASVAAWARHALRVFLDCHLAGTFPRSLDGIPARMYVKGRRGLGDG
jgi:hypothetical protein